MAITWLEVLDGLVQFIALLNKAFDFLLGSIRNPQSATEEFIGGKINDYFTQKFAGKALV